MTRGAYIKPIQEKTFTAKTYFGDWLNKNYKNGAALETTDELGDNLVPSLNLACPVCPAGKSSPV